MATPAQVLELIDAVDGSLAVPPQSFPDAKLLDGTARSALMRHVDEHHLTTGPKSMDVRLSLSEAELEQLVGASATRRLFDHFGVRPTDIRLRRVEANSDDPVCVPFHTDYSKRTMQVPLNDPHEYDGGSLVWAVDGALETPPRPAGSATIHTKDVVHAVTRMSHGTRYGLFLCELPEKHEVDLLHLIDPAVEQLSFFRRAVAFLDNATNTQLRACTIEYHQHLVDSIQAEGAEDSDINIEMALPSFEVELIWRAHLLSPVAYARDCAALRGGGGESTRLIDHAPLPVESYASRDATMAINAAVAPTGMPQAWHADLVVSGSGAPPGRLHAPNAEVAAEHWRVWAFHRRAGCRANELQELLGRGCWR